MNHGGLSGSVLDARGNTPIIEIEGIHCKLESLNPSGLVKAHHLTPSVGQRASSTVKI
jgi:hypothetical protein